VDSQISVLVSEWRGELLILVDRVGRSGHRRYAPRTRLATFRARAVREVSEDEACLWLLEQLTLWVNAGCPRTRRGAAPASPVGDHRGQRAIGAPTGAEGRTPLPSKTVRPPEEGSGAAGVSDGLKPNGAQPPLF
jgi:hypothetical protein